MIGRRSAPPDKVLFEPKGFDDYDLRLGDIMRGERATMGKSLLDVQRELKIKATYIAAIENSDPSAFETPGFIAGYVRSYARYLNLDPEWAYGKFCDEGNFAVVHGLSAQASGAKSARVPARKTVSQDPFENPNTPFVPRVEGLMSRIEPGALGSSLVLVALIGVIGFGGWSVLQEVQKVQFTPVDQTPGVVSEIDPLAPGESLGTGASETAGLEPPPADALNRLYRPQALDVPVLTARDGPIAALRPDTVDTLMDVEPDTQDVVVAENETATAIEEAVVQVVAENAPEVVMFAVRPSWVRVRGADGTVLFEKILDAGERYVLPRTEEPPLLRAGNAGSVYFAVNGETYGPAGTGPSVIKNVALGADDLKARYVVADLEKDRDLARIVAEATILAPAE